MVLAAVVVKLVHRALHVPGQAGRLKRFLPLSLSDQFPVRVSGGCQESWDALQTGGFRNGL